MISLTFRAVLITGSILAVAGGFVQETGQRRAKFRASVLRPTTPLDPRFTKEIIDGQSVERGTFLGEPGERVPVLIHHPKETSGRLPVVIALHGTGGSKEGLKPLLTELAKRGFLAVAIDGRFHGQRVAGGAKDTAAHNDAIVKSWQDRANPKRFHPFYWDTVNDVWRLIDYLATRPDVDPKRIGLVGFSKGGIETWFAAAGDTRIAASVPAISVQCFKWSLENGRWQARANTIKRAHEAVAREMGEPEVNAKVCRELWPVLLPGILDEFDCPRMLELIAPRPMLILSGENDPNCPLPGAEIAFNAARKAYNEAGLEERLEIDVAKGIAHQVTDPQRAKMLVWFERWLKP